jgi:hypothetical protein
MEVSMSDERERVIELWMVDGSGCSVHGQVTIRGRAEVIEEAAKRIEAKNVPKPP